MSDLQVDDLQEGTAEQGTVDAKKEEKHQAKVALIATGVTKLKELPVSDEMLKVLESGAVEAWVARKGNEEEGAAKDSAKEALIEAFGGVEALKAFCDRENGDFAKEIEEYKGVSAALSQMNNIVHFYSKRAGSGSSSKKVKKQPIKIDGEYYQVSAAYILEIADKPREEKLELLLAHPDTTKEAVTEL